MNRKSQSPLIFTSVLVLAVLACSLGSQAGPEPTDVPSEPQNPVEPQTTVSSSAVEGACTNPYFPAVLNASWTYKSSGTSKGEYLFTDVVAEVRADGFTISTDFGDTTKVNEWSCSPEGLQVYQTGGGDQSAGLSINSGQFQLDATILNASGVTLPVTIDPGNQWIQSYDYKTEGNLGGNSMTSTGTVESRFEVLGIESITTPAGTFQAVKIREETRENASGTIGGATLNSSSESITFYWFVEGVGRVRTETTGSRTETTELQAYSIP